MSETMPTPLVQGDPYGAATQVTALERQRLTVQFSVHTGPTVDRALVALKGARGLKVLDVGSGFGALLSKFGAPPATPSEVRFVDPNRGLIAAASARATEMGIRWRAHDGAIDQGPIPEAMTANDLAVCSFTATHLDDLSAGLEHIAGALRPNGLLVLVDVDYVASMADGDVAATQALDCIKQKLRVTDLASSLTRRALACGLHPIEAIPCTTRLQAYLGADAVRHIGLGFIGNFHREDPAVDAWRRIGPRARLYLQRIAHVYVRA